MAEIEDKSLEQRSPTTVLAERFSVGLRSLRSGLERVTGSVADSASRGRDRAAEAAGGLRRSTPLRHGMAAAERGNLDAALALLREATEQDPEDDEGVLALWNVALTTASAEVAAPAMARWIHKEASAGRCQLAVDFWVELSEQVPAERTDAPTLVRMLPELQRRVAEARDAAGHAAAETQLLRALRQSVEPEARALTAGLALHVFELARSIDAATARRAGEIVLSASDLHEAKRHHVEGMLAQLGEPASSEEPDANEAPTPLEAPEADAELHRETAEAPAEEPASPPSAPTHRVIDAVPVELSGNSLIVRKTEDGQRARLDLRSVEAIAVACIGEGDAKPAPLIDLVMSSRPAAKRIQVVRMHTDAFDASEVLQDTAPADDPLGGLLGALLDRSGAVPLPDPDSALGIDPKAFASIDDYQERVLSRLGPCSG